MATIEPLTETDVAPLARASGLGDDPARVAALAATLPIVNALRAALWAAPAAPADEPAHLFAVEAEPAR